MKSLGKYLKILGIATLLCISAGTIILICLFPAMWAESTKSLWWLLLYLPITSFVIFLLDKYNVITDD